MEAQVSEPRRDESAYAMLSKQSHQTREARRARSRIEGRRIEPQEMLAKRFALRFSREITPQTTGDTASVEVSGDEPTDHATLHCVKRAPLGA